MYRRLGYAAVGVIVLAIAAASFFVWRSYQPIIFSEQVAEFGRFGPIRIGMTLPEMRAAARLHFKPQYHEGGDVDAAELDAADCYYAFPEKADVEVRFMMAYGKLARIEIENKTTALRTLRVGSAEADVFSVFEGRVRKEPHKYIDDTGFYLIAMQDEQSGFLFETDEGQVIAYRIGKIPELGYVEGCL